MQSLGAELLQDIAHADFELIMYDGETRVVTTVHRLVLKTCSPYMARNIGGIHFFFYHWNVPKGHIAAAIRLIKFFYTRDWMDLGDREQTLTLCQQLECSEIYAALSQRIQKRPKEHKKTIITTTTTIRTETRSSNRRLRRRV